LGYASAILAGTPQAQLLTAQTPKRLKGMTAEAKRADSFYHLGRSKIWLKIKNRRHPALMRVPDSFERKGGRSTSVFFLSF
jgi:ATP-dependent DNA ligase